MPSYRAYKVGEDGRIVGLLFEFRISPFFRTALLADARYNKLFERRLLLLDDPSGFSYPISHLG
jgi:hypothetical protein